MVAMKANPKVSKQEVMMSIECIETGKLFTMLLAIGIHPYSCCPLHNNKPITVPDTVPAIPIIIPLKRKICFI